MTKRETYIFFPKKFVELQDYENEILYPQFKHSLLFSLGNQFNLEYFIYTLSPSYTGMKDFDILDKHNFEYLKKVGVETINENQKSISRKIIHLVSRIISLNDDSNYQNFTKKTDEKRELLLNFIKNFEEFQNQLNAINGILIYLNRFKNKDTILINEINTYAISLINIEKYKDKKNKQDVVDLSNTKATQKIIYLQELGIIDYLRTKEPFNLSTNALATILSAITGEKTETLQSYLNPIINTTSGQKNNPLNSIKNTQKVKQTLTNLGFK